MVTPILSSIERLENLQGGRLLFSWLRIMNKGMGHHQVHVQEEGMKVEIGHKRQG
jgi:hypothetical protein